MGNIKIASAYFPCARHLVSDKYFGALNMVLNLVSELLTYQVYINERIHQQLHDLPHLKVYRLQKNNAKLFFR